MKNKRSISFSRGFSPVMVIGLVVIVAVVLVGFNQIKNKQLASISCTTEAELNTMLSTKSSLESQIASMNSQIDVNNELIVTLQTRLVTLNSKISGASGAELAKFNNEKRILDSDITKADVKSVELNTSLSGLQDKLNTLNKSITDAENNLCTESMAVTTQVVTGDTVAPTVSIVGPTNGSVIGTGGFVNVYTRVYDNVEVAKVEFYIDGALTGKLTRPNDRRSPDAYIYKWSLSKVAAGFHTIMAKAYDSSNNSATSTTITVKTLVY